ncbi:MAG: hypothetical protein ACREQM_11150 [Candidatus Dormibacteraceae bacterium]
MSEPLDPVVGWRLWELDGHGLSSRDGEYRWDVGENQASCSAKTGRPCEVAPGPGCHCGFWGLWGPGRCLHRAAELGVGAGGVLGLVAGWGTVAYHGDEGFRAGQARPIALFSDWPWDEPALTRGARRLQRWLFRRQREPGAGAGKLDARGRRTSHLAAAAARYQVPMLTLDQAVRFGVLGELGVRREGCAELDAILRLEPAG